ncbi:MAG: phage gp6-like head-tail connector protein [Muribaculaceae bacterium]|nr:phage gp6-like head-tail connector protein [Muribaculaceae bacterium]
MFLELELIKKHLNIDSTFLEDDEYLMYLGEVAEKVIEKHTDTKLNQLAEVNGDMLPKPLLHAMLLFIGDMYRNRESVVNGSITEIPFSYDYILGLYKNYKGDIK